MCITRDKLEERIDILGLMIINAYDRITSNLTNQSYISQQFKKIAEWEKERWNLLHSVLD